MTEGHDARQAAATLSNRFAQGSSNQLQMWGLSGAPTQKEERRRRWGSGSVLLGVAQVLADGFPADSVVTAETAFGTPLPAPWTGSAARSGVRVVERLPSLEVDDCCPWTSVRQDTFHGFRKFLRRPRPAVFSAVGPGSSFVDKARPMAAGLEDGCRSADRAGLFSRCPYLRGRWPSWLSCLMAAIPARPDGQQGRGFLGFPAASVAVGCPKSSCHLAGRLPDVIDRRCRRASC
jgi:hypothetical protein